MPLLIRWFVAATLVLTTIAAAHNTKPVGPEAADSLRRALQSRVASRLPAAMAPAAHGAPTDAHPSAARPPGAVAHAATTPADARATAPPGALHGDGAEGAWATWKELLAGNARFAAGKPQTRQLVPTREALRTGQKPRTIVLGCADSRCPPELLFDQTLGELFVVRTAGNVADPIALGSIEYAAEHLGAHLLVVLGHDACGAVKATLAGGDLPSDNLRAIVERIRPAVSAARAHWSGEELLPHAIAANAQQSARDLLVRSPVLRDAVEHGHLRIVTAVYHFDDGRVAPLD
jgi:carbonic anhydrase